ncbi:MAG: oligopeptide/dipeptide ABC transporter ATP-binding protein, partial [Woeseiaceae bacterium]
PAHPYTQLLLASIPRLDAGKARYPVLEGEPPDPANRPPGCPFEPRCHRREDRCRRDLPELRGTRGGTRAACFFADDPRPLPMRAPDHLCLTRQI